MHSVVIAVSDDVEALYLDGKYVDETEDGFDIPDIEAATGLTVDEYQFDERFVDEDWFYYQEDSIFPDLLDDVVFID